MGEVIGAGVVAHVPTIVLPEATRRELNEGNEISLVPGLHRLRREVLDVLRPDTIVVVDSHWFTTVETVVGAHLRRDGFYTSDELPRGMSSVPYGFDGDPELAGAIAKAADDVDQCWITPIDDPYLPIHYATVNLLGFLQGGERWVPLSVCQTGDTLDFLAVGECLRRAVERLDRRVVILASGGMTHTFWPLRELRAHEASDPTHIRTAEAAAADREVLDDFSDGDHAAVIDGMPDYLPFRPEGRFGHYLTMVGALGGADCRAPGRPFSDYENSIGTGQIHVWFDRPADGWTG